MRLIYEKILLLSVMLGGVCMNAAAMFQNDFVPANPAEAQDEDATPVVVENETSDPSEEQQVPAEPQDEIPVSNSDSEDNHGVLNDDLRGVLANLSASMREGYASEDDQVIPTEEKKEEPATATEQNLSIDELKAEIEALKGQDLDHTKNLDLMKRLDACLDDAQRLENSYKKQLKKAKKRCKGMESMIQCLDDICAILEQSNKKLYSNWRNLYSENDQLKAENDQLKAENDQLKAENDQLKAENAILRGRNIVA